MFAKWKCVSGEKLKSGGKEQPWSIPRVDPTLPPDSALRPWLHQPANCSNATPACVNALSARAEMQLDGRVSQNSNRSKIGICRLAAMHAAEGRVFAL